MSPPSLSEASMMSDSESTSGHGFKLKLPRLTPPAVIMMMMMALAKLVARHGELRVTVMVSTA